MINVDGKLQYDTNSCNVSCPTAFYEKEHFLQQ